MEFIRVLFRFYRKSIFFFFKQKTAYEMVSCDWSPDVCSSDLPQPDREGRHEGQTERPQEPRPGRRSALLSVESNPRQQDRPPRLEHAGSVVPSPAGVREAALSVQAAGHG